MVIHMKKIIALSLSLAVAVSMCGCNDKDKKDSKKTTTTSVLEFVELPPDTYEGFEIEVTHNSFAGLSDFTTIHNNSSVFFANLVCNAPEGLADGVYGCPDVKATVNGVDFNRENLAYIYVSQGKATITLSFFAGYVKKNSEISVTLNNFNKLREPENSDDTVSYDETTDEIVLKGSLTIRTTADKDFGYYKFDLSDLNGGSVSLSDTTATITGAEGVFGENADAKALTVILDNGEKVTFDFCTKNHKYDDEGNPTEEYDLVFMFDDSAKTINLASVTDIRINDASVMK